MKRRGEKAREVRNKKGRRDEGKRRRIEEHRRIKCRRKQ